MIRATAVVSALLLSALNGAPAAQAENASGGGTKKIVRPAEYSADLPYSPAVWSGDLLFLSGAIGAPAGTSQIKDGIAAQTRQGLDNLEALLVEAGLDMSRVVSMNMFLTDLREFDALWSQVEPRIQGATAAGSAVEAEIALAGGRMEISMVAAKKGVEIRSIRPKGWMKPRGGGQWAVMAGDTLFMSGMASIDPTNGQFVGGDLKSQIDRAMGNLTTLLKTASLDWGDVARCKVFLPDPHDYGPMNDAYGAFMTSEPPGRATVKARLLQPEARFGVQCFAVKSVDRKVVKAAGAAPGNRPFSPAIQTGGRVYTAGMVGLGDNGFPPDLGEQTRLTLSSLEATLKAAGLGFGDVVNATVYLSDPRYYDAMNKVYKEVVGKNPPARATVGMPLMTPHAWVEIQMTAESRD